MARSSQGFLVNRLDEPAPQFLLDRETSPHDGIALVFIDDFRHQNFSETTENLFVTFVFFVVGFYARLPTRTASAHSSARTKTTRKPR